MTETSDLRFDSETIKVLLDAFEESDWEEMRLTIGGNSLHIARSGAATLGDAPSPVPSAAPVASAAPTPPSTPTASPPPPAPVSAGDDGAGAAATPGDGVPVESPTVGIFWVAPSPGAPPFVEVGTRVDADSIVGIVEVMKLMNQVPAGVAGVVTEVLVDNGEAVEFAQPLVRVRPDDA